MDDISKAFFLVHESDVTDEEAGKLYKLLHELELLRRSQIQPAVKYLSNTIDEQLDKVTNEFEELMNELIDLVDHGNEDARPRSLDECNDMQIVIETLKAIIEPDEDKRRESMIKTIQKNIDRIGGSYYAKQP